MIKKYNLANDMNTKIINSLKNLPRVNAPGDFEINLKHRLNTLEIPAKSKKLFTFRLNRVLIPAFGLLASLVLVFFLFYFQRTVDVNKLQTNPSVSRDENKTVVKPENSVNQGGLQKGSGFTDKASIKEIQSSSANNTKESKSRLKEFISSVPGRNVDQSLRARPESSAVYGEDTPQPVQFNEYNPFLESDRVLEKPNAPNDTLSKNKVKKK